LQLKIPAGSAPTIKSVCWFELVGVSVGLARVIVGAPGGTMSTVSRWTTIEPEVLPKAFVQATVIVFAPSASGTLLVVALLDAEPFRVQVVSAGIDGPPSAVYVTLMVVAVVISPSAGAVIATTGATPRVTVTAALLLPKAFVQATVIVFAPSVNANGLAVALEVFDPPTVQVVPPGIDAAPLMVKLTFVEAAVVFSPSAGAVIATAGGSPRVTVTEPEPVPKLLVQSTTIELAPIASEALLVVALPDAEPLTVQLVPPGIDAAPLTVKLTFVEAAVVLRPSAGAVIATLGGFPR
jgi:hypothetical protein